jgi:hypothetical protein
MPAAAVAGLEGIEVRRAVGERVGDARAALLRHRLVPDGDVVVDRGGDVVHAVQRTSAASSSQLPAR